MRRRQNGNAALFIISAIIIFMAAAFLYLRGNAGLLLGSPIQRPALRPAVERQEVVVAWRDAFIPPSGAGPESMPQGWRLAEKPLTRPASFSVRADEKTDAAYLHMEADDASASIVTRPEGVDLKKTPILRWRWRVTAFPDGADGRFSGKDDQAIGIYVGAGTALSNKSVSYRWDSETPKGSTGDAAYGLGGIRVKWYTLRSGEDGKGGAWFVEERNVADDFQKAWGFLPDKVYISISCNSQYTGSKAAADLGWVEFISLPHAKEEAKPWGER